MKEESSLDNISNVSKRLISFFAFLMILMPNIVLDSYFHKKDYFNVFKEKGDKLLLNVKNDKEKVVNNLKSFVVWITAYNSTFDQTDDTPFITASNKFVRDGIVASNFLPFGTKIKIPSLFGDKIFVVEDRMRQDKNNHIDIWMEDISKAKEFGIKRAKIFIVEEEKDIAFN
jgi:3D (Asp-Asp-Asp) domain-containing protein